MTAQRFQAVFCAVFTQQIKHAIVAWNAGKIHSGLFPLQTSVEECLKDLMTNTLPF